MSPIRFGSEHQSNPFWIVYLFSFISKLDANFLQWKIKSCDCPLLTFFFLLKIYTIDTTSWISHDFKRNAMIRGEQMDKCKSGGAREIERESEAAKNAASIASFYYISLINLPFISNESFISWMIYLTTPIILCDFSFVFFCVVVDFRNLFLVDKSNQMRHTNVVTAHFFFCSFVLVIRLMAGVSQSHAVKWCDKLVACTITWDWQIGKIIIATRVKIHTSWLLLISIKLDSCFGIAQTSDFVVYLFKFAFNIRNSDNHVNCCYENKWNSRKKNVSFNST